MNKNRNKYDLTQEEYNKCLTMAEISIFMKGQTEKNPCSIFVVAQPGARKNWIKKLCH